MPELAFKKTFATMKKVNPRKEKHGDELVLACDVTFEARVSNDVLSCLDIAGQSIKSHFWDKGTPRFPQISGLSFEQKFEHHVITIGAKEYKDVTVCKLKANPLEGDIAILFFTVQLRPSKQQVGILADLAEEQVEISIESLQGDLLDEALKNAGEEPED